jgi:hypothetical protein
MISISEAKNLKRDKGLVSNGQRRPPREEKKQRGAGRSALALTCYGTTTRILDSFYFVLTNRDLLSA